MCFVFRFHFVWALPSKLYVPYEDIQAFPARLLLPLCSWGLWAVCLSSRRLSLLAQPLSSWPSTGPEKFLGLPAWTQGCRELSLALGPQVLRIQKPGSWALSFPAAWKDRRVKPKDERKARNFFPRKWGDKQREPHPQMQQGPEPAAPAFPGTGAPSSQLPGPSLLEPVGTGLLPSSSADKNVLGAAWWTGLHRPEAWCLRHNHHPPSHLPPHTPDARTGT